MQAIAGYLLPHPPLIVPEVGKGQEARIETTVRSYQEAAQAIAALYPETVIIITPHSTVYSDYFHISPERGAEGDLARFGGRERIFAEYDETLVRQITNMCEMQGISAGTAGEKERSLDHGTFIPLYFLNQACSDYRVVRISPSGLSRELHYRFGQILTAAAERIGRRTVVIASGDLSHKLTEDGPYGFAPEGPELDQRLTAIMESANFGDLLTLDERLCRKGVECGYLPLLMLAGSLDGKAVESRLYSYEGPLGVGYAVASFHAGQSDLGRQFLDIYAANKTREAQDKRAEEDDYVRLARGTLETRIRENYMSPLPQTLPEEMLNRRAGVFVSIKKHGELRGCIGTISATQPNIAEEIRQNAISAGLRDPRFPPIRASEIDALTYSVDILGKPEDATEDMLDTQKYGVIVKSGQRKGLLLPNLDGVDSVEQQIAIAREKAGISKQERYTIQRFEVVRHT